MATASPTDHISKFNNNNADSLTSNNCQTTFSRKLPNCGTYFFKHISSSEDEYANNNHRSASIAGSLISSSSPTPRLEDPLEPFVLTSSPLKTSGSEPLLFDDEELQDLDDEDLDNLIMAEEQDQAELQHAKVSSIAGADGRRIPVLDFSDLQETEEQAEARRELENFRKNSIKKLVGDAEKLLFQTVSFSSDDTDEEGVDSHTVSASELSMYRSSKANKTNYKRSHSFHNYGSPSINKTKSKDDGCEASGEGTSNAPSSEDDSVQDAEMKSQHNQSAYSLVLVDTPTSSESPVHSTDQPVSPDSTLKFTEERKDPEPTKKPKRKSSKARNKLNSSGSSGGAAAYPSEDDGVGELAEYWDQEKYLSEHNYDEPIDVDKTFKLLNFGDDYRNFIGSGGSDFSDFACCKLGAASGSSANNTSRSSKNRRRIRRTTVTIFNYLSRRLCSIV